MQRIDFIKKDYKWYANKITNIKEKFYKKRSGKWLFFVNLVGLYIDAFVVDLVFINTLYY